MYLFIKTQSFSLLHRVEQLGQTKMYAQYKINTPNRTPSKRSNLINYKTNDHNESNADEVITCSELRYMVKELLQGRCKCIAAFIF